MIHYEGDLTLVAGAARTGKTHNMKRAVAAKLETRAALGVPSRLVVFDPPGNWRPEGATVVRTPGELAAAVAALRFPIVVQATFTNWYPLVYGPPNDLKMVWYLVLVVDEQHNYCAAAPSTIHPTFHKLLCEGRGHAAADIFVGTQSMGDLNSAVLTNANKGILLPIRFPTHRTKIESAWSIKLPREWQPVGPPAPPTACVPVFYPEDYPSGPTYTPGGRANV